MSVGAGKTALGVVACLAFTRRRALIVTPGSVILGTFGAALDANASRNVLYALPGGPLLPGCRPPRVLVLDRERDDAQLGAIRDVTREQLLAADVIVTNFHSLGTGEDADDLLAKLHPDGVPDELRSVMAEAFQLEAQQARGAWFLPETASIDAAMVTYAFSLRHHGRYAHTLAAQERAKLPLSGNPDAMVVWAVLQPLFEHLLAPVRLRVDEGGMLERAEFVERWSAYERALADLRLDVAAALAPFRWGGGWSRHDAERQVTAKMALLTTLGATVDVEVLRRHRARATRALVTQYYAKAKKGRAKRRQVLTKELARSLAAFFGGDWLAFVRYLGDHARAKELSFLVGVEVALRLAGARAGEPAARQRVRFAKSERVDRHREQAVECLSHVTA
jgi:hypothetical protein